MIRKGTDLESEYIYSIKQGQSKIGIYWDGVSNRQIRVNPKQDQPLGMVGPIYKVRLNQNKNLQGRFVQQTDKGQSKIGQSARVGY